MSVEWPFGHLKGRWQCILKRYCCQIDRINTIITASCVMPGTHRPEMSHGSRNQMTFSPCAQRSVRQKPISQQASVERAWENQHLISGFWQGAIPLSEHICTEGEIAALTSLLLVERSVSFLFCFFVQPTGLKEKNV